MIISVWRYSHLLLAVFSFIILTIASATGVILAFEPVTERAKGYRVDGFDSLKIATVAPLLKTKFEGIQELTVDEYDHVVISFINKSGSTEKAYVNPATAEILGKVHEKSALFRWATDLHRSLFLHETGRLIVGITSFLLILIALSGIMLVIQRQKGIRRFFDPIEKSSFAQYYHVLFGRLALFFILAIALTGTHLSLGRFGLAGSSVAKAEVDIDTIKEDPQIKPENFPFFRNTFLSDLRTLQYPFSDFPEDYFTLKLKDREVSVNQFTGELLAESKHTSAQQWSEFSLRWHTGRSNTVWAILMGIASAYILFFIYSGFWITIKRLRNRAKNKFKPEECSTIILVGSENGTSFKFARTVYRQLIAHGQKVYLTDLNNYRLFPKASQLIIMTATYGLGDPPSNAKQFASKLKKYQQLQQMQFSVVGFGSRSYPEFCKFAFDTDRLLRQQPWASPLTEVFTINDRSPQDFSDWLTAWSNRSALPLTISRELLEASQHANEKLTVVYKTPLDENDAFLIRLKPGRRSKVVSGDLVAIYPKQDHRERIYSLGKLGKEIQVSVKMYPKGLGSSYLFKLEPGETIPARFIKNQHFHFPSKASSIVMISNGTGIGPFLGMIDENKKRRRIHLYCGFKTHVSFNMYKSFLSEQIGDRKLTRFHLALSREDERLYVSELISRDAVFIAQTLLAGGVLMICGSLSMEKDVMAVLEHICQQKGIDLQACIEKKQVLTDCY